jgi:hypothetical protein
LVEIAGPTKYILKEDLPDTIYRWEDITLSTPG